MPEELIMTWALLVMGVGLLGVPIVFRPSHWVQRKRPLFVGCGLVLVAIGAWMLRSR